MNDTSNKPEPFPPEALKKLAGWYTAYGLGDEATTEEKLAHLREHQQCMVAGDPPPENDEEELKAREFYLLIKELKHTL